jgi:hypothetical protein
MKGPSPVRRPGLGRRQHEDREVEDVIVWYEGVEQCDGEFAVIGADTQMPRRG